MAISLKYSVRYLYTTQNQYLIQYQIQFHRSTDSDLRFCRFFGLTDGYWLRAQEAYDLEVTRRKPAPELKRIRPFNQAACL